MPSRSSLVSLAALALVLVATAPAAGDRSPTVDRLMVWEVPAEVILGGPVDLEVEVLRNGRAVHRESFTVEVPPGVAAGAVEILAGDDEKRARLAGLSERVDARFEARIRRGGEEIGRLPLRDLLARGAALAERPAELLPLRYQEDPQPEAEGELFVLTAAGTDCSEREACTQQCWNDYYACIGTYCPGYETSRRLPAECQHCADDRYTCQQACPPCKCTEPKSETYSTSVTPVSYSWSGSDCYTDVWGSTEGNWWDRYTVEYKYTEYKHTEACDGTVTTTVQAIWYEYGTCYDRTFYWCSGAWYGTPSPRC